MKSAKSHQLAQTLRSPQAAAGGADAMEDEAFASDVELTVAVEELETSSPGANSGASRCLTDEDILRYWQGDSSAAQRHYIHEHLDACVACRTLVYLVVQDRAEDISSVSPRGVARVTTFTRGSLVSGRYRIDRFVARSGMGEVYEAFDTLRQKRVALKTVLCTSSDDPRAVRALTSEVEHALLVSHPNVCRVYELGEHRSRRADEPSVRYLTMEFVDGETLGRRIRREPERLPLREVREIAVQVLAGLAAAHAKGVLHLDLKSDNVMLRGGVEPVEALIMDFGLSRTRGASSTLHPSEQELRGTPGYMAPEQLECVATSRATDVYAFGVMLFELLVGQLPFEADSLGALLLKQLRTRPPAPSSLRRGLSPALDNFVLGCLQRQPGQRYPDAAHALAALERVRVWESPPLGARRGRRAARAAVGFGFLVALLATLALRRAPPAVRSLPPVAVPSAPVDAVVVVEGQLNPVPEAGARELAPEVLQPQKAERAAATPRAPEIARRRAARGAPVPPPVPHDGAGSVDGAAPASSAAAGESPAPSVKWQRIPPGGFWIPQPSTNPTGEPGRGAAPGEHAPRDQNRP